MAEKRTIRSPYLSRLWRFGRGRRSGDEHESLLLITLPKSGSIFLRRSLASSLGLKAVDPSPGYVPVDHLNVKTMARFAHGGCIGQTHIDPSPFNLAIIDHFRITWLLHVRDPRSALLSWIHHVDRLRVEEPELLLYSSPLLPAAYWSMPFEDKLDWQILHHYPQSIDWIERWVDVIDKRDHNLLTTFDQMHNRDEDFIRELIGRIYGNNSRTEVKLPQRTMRGSHFRSGRRDEWQDVFSREQLDRSTRMIPESLRQRFGWHDTRRAGAGIPIRSSPRVAEYGSASDALVPACQPDLADPIPVHMQPQTESVIGRHAGEALNLGRRKNA